MEQIDRRSALAFGLVGVSGLVLSGQAAAQTYGPSEGKETGPGVRQVDLGERASVIPAYGKVRLRDIVVQPGSKTPENMMMNDMLCHMTEGELAVVQNNSMKGTKVSSPVRARTASSTFSSASSGPSPSRQPRPARRPPR